MDVLLTFDDEHGDAGLDGSNHFRQAVQHSPGIAELPDPNRRCRRGGADGSPSVRTEPPRTAARRPRRRMGRWLRCGGAVRSASGAAQTGRVGESCSGEDVTDFAAGVAVEQHASPSSPVDTDSDGLRVGVRGTDGGCAVSPLLLRTLRRDSTSSNGVYCRHHEGRRWHAEAPAGPISNVVAASTNGQSSSCRAMTWPPLTTSISTSQRQPSNRTAVTASLVVFDRRRRRVVALMTSPPMCNQSVTPQG